MLLTTAMNRILDIFPNATIGQDNAGQLVVYTDKRLVTRNGVEELVDFDFDS